MIGRVATIRALEVDLLASVTLAAACRRGSEKQ